MHWTRTYKLPITIVSGVIEELVMRDSHYKIANTYDVDWDDVSHNNYEGVAKPILYRSGRSSNQIAHSSIVGRRFGIIETSSLIFSSGFNLKLIDTGLIKHLLGVKDSGSIALDMLGLSQRNAETYIDAWGDEFPRFSSNLRKELDTLLIATGR